MYFAIEISARIWYSWPIDLSISRDRKCVNFDAKYFVYVINLFHLFFSADPHIRCINFIRRRKENINIRRLPNPYKVTFNQTRRKEPEKSAQENQEQGWYYYYKQFHGFWSHLREFE